MCSGLTIEGVIISDEVLQQRLQLCHTSLRLARRHIQYTKPMGIEQKYALLHLKSQKYRIGIPTMLHLQQNIGVGYILYGAHIYSGIG